MKRATAPSSHSHSFSSDGSTVGARHSAQEPHGKKIGIEEADPAGQDGDLELQPLLLAETAGDSEGRTEPQR